MPWYEIYCNDGPFEKYYDIKPHLSKVHERHFKKNCNDEYLEFANRYHPSDYDEWVSSLGKLYKYEKELYAKVDRQDNLIIVSYYNLMYQEDSGKHYLFMRFIYDIETTSMYHYRMMSFKAFAYVLNKCDGEYRFGGYTDMDRFYVQKQYALDEKSIHLLKSIEIFKYLPIELFKTISVYKLFQVNEDTIYQYEILLKNGLVRLASDMLERRVSINPDNFKKFKKEIMSGARLNKVNRLISTHEEKEEDRLRRIEKKEQAQVFEKMPKQKYNLGDYILRHPKNFKELQKEGRELNHCVAGYLDKIVNKETDILFLRKKEEPEVPYFTIELSNERIIQCRTLKNQTDPEITSLVKQWNEQRLGGA